MHQETFGKSGCRRIVPGQFLACDPKGRALMIGSISVILLPFLCSLFSLKRMTFGETICLLVVGIIALFETISEMYLQ